MPFAAEILIAVLLLTCAFMVQPPKSPAHIFKVSEANYVSMEEMIEDLLGADLVFIGELHDRAGHHHAQLQVIRALRESGAELAIGLEMFRREDQPSLDRWVGGELDERGFVSVYNKNWSSWPLYRDIFVYAREEGIPLLGLNISRALTGQVARNGFGSLSPEQVGELPGVECNVDSRYQEFIRRSLGSHPHNGATFRNFCEAQLLWDTVMARALLDYRALNPGRIVVVLAGGGHAWKHGIPEQVRRKSKVIFRVLLPEIPGRVDPGTMTPAETDYLLLGLEQAPLH